MIIIYIDACRCVLMIIIYIDAYRCVLMIIIYIDAYRCVLMIIIYIDAYRCLLMIFMFFMLKRLTGIKWAREQHLPLLSFLWNSPPTVKIRNHRSDFALQHFLF